MGYTGAFIYKTGICSPCASKCMRAKSPDRAVSEPLNHHPDSSFRSEVRCNTVLLSKAHYEVPSNVVHDQTDMLLLGHDVRMGPTTLLHQLCMNVDVFTLKMNGFVDLCNTD